VTLKFLGLKTSAN